MRAIVIASLLAVGMLTAVTTSHAQTISIGSNGVQILPSQYYAPYQSQPSYYGAPSYQYQYATPYYSNYSYPSSSYPWNGGWDRGLHYHPPTYHQGYWHGGHYHPGHWHAGYLHQGRR